MKGDRASLELAEPPRKRRLLGTGLRGVHRVRR